MLNACLMRSIYINKQKRAMSEWYFKFLSKINAQTHIWLTDKGIIAMLQ